MKKYPNLKVYTRKKGGELEAPFEKPVIVPEKGDGDISRNLWTEARFATDIMAEHSVFFTLLMPPETAKKEREEAMKFTKIFTDLFKKIEEVSSDQIVVKKFASDITEAYKPFIEYKDRNEEAQKEGKLGSLVWPLFFNHTSREAQRWLERIEQIAKGEVEYERNEVTKFWTVIMEEHARFIAHLLDPDEFELISQTMNIGQQFAELPEMPEDTAIKKAMAEGVVTEMPMPDETADILTAAENILEFKTAAARGIEAAKIKSIIDPRLADHVRREAQKFYDELTKVA